MYVCVGGGVFMYDLLVLRARTTTLYEERAALAGYSTLRVTTIALKTLIRFDFEIAVL